MGRKRQKKQWPGTKAVLARIERELAKGNAKEALKDAKHCYRSEPTPECRSLLEQAYASRVEQLHKMRMTAEARAVLSDLLELKPATPDVKGRIPRLQTLVGDTRVDSTAMLRSDPALLQELVDSAMLDPESAPPDFDSLPRLVQRLRDALAAVERGEDDAASELIREIPRSSPLADWKLLVRGLSAFYQSDRERTEENWRRLDRNRPAWRIAASLQSAAGESLNEDAQRALAQPLKRLNAWLQGGSLLPLLSRLSQHWQSGDWRQFLPEFRRLRARCEDSHVEILDSLVDMTWKRAVREGDERLFQELQHSAAAPGIDPRWMRANALMQESFRDDIEFTTECWERFLESLQCSSLRPDEQPIAAGLVHLHLARLKLSIADDLLDLDIEDEYNNANVKAQELLKSAMGYLHKAIRSYPPLVEAYRELSSLHDRRGEPEKSAGAVRRLLEQSPDDYEAHAKLAQLYLELEDPAKSEPHIEAISRLRPRGLETRVLRWNHTLAMVRALTKAKQYEAARQELAKVAQAPPADVVGYVVPTIRAAIELKAGGEEAAQRHLDEALASVEEPTIVWMQMAVLAARMSLPVKTRKDFNERFKKALKKKPRSETAGGLAKIVRSFRANNYQYVGRATHQRLVHAYLKRTAKIRWQEADLKQVCMCLDIGKDRVLRENLLERGMKRYRNSPYFTIHYAIQRLYEIGRLGENHDVYQWHWELNELHRKVDRAMAEARQASPLDESLIGDGQRALASIEQAQALLRRPRPFYFHPLGEVEDEYDEEDDDDDDDVYAGDPPAPAEMSRMFNDAVQSMPIDLRRRLEQAAERNGKTPEQYLVELMVSDPKEFAAMLLEDLEL
ncbi:MAG: tetratricopeptide repeat protein [Pirellulaceae bacterium]